MLNALFHSQRASGPQGIWFWAKTEISIRIGMVILPDLQHG